MKRYIMTRMCNQTSVFWIIEPCVKKWTLINSSKSTTMKYIEHIHTLQVSKIPLCILSWYRVCMWVSGRISGSRVLRQVQPLLGILGTFGYMFNLALTTQRSTGHIPFCSWSGVQMKNGPVQELRHRKVEISARFSHPAAHRSARQPIFIDHSNRGFPRWSVNITPFHSMPYSKPQKAVGHAHMIAAFHTTKPRGSMIQQASTSPATAKSPSIAKWRNDKNICTLLDRNLRR